MAAGREVLVSDMPPELIQQQPLIPTTTSDIACDDWQLLLAHWADQLLVEGRTSLLDAALPIFERTMIETALKHTGGRRRDAAELLGWGRNTLTRKIKELDMRSTDHTS